MAAGRNTSYLSVTLVLRGMLLWLALRCGLVYIIIIIIIIIVVVVVVIIFLVIIIIIVVVVVVVVVIIAVVVVVLIVKLEGNFTLKVLYLGSVKPVGCVLCSKCCQTS